MSVIRDVFYNRIKGGFSPKTKDLIKRFLTKLINMNPNCRKEGLYKRVSYGKEDPDKVYAVFQRFSQIEGLFSDFYVFAAAADWAVEHGLIPIFDRKTYPPMQYLEKSEYGKKNGWEEYFKQPCGVSLEDVENGGKKNVRIYLVPHFYNDIVFDICRKTGSKLRGDELRVYQCFIKKYMRPQDAMKKKIDEEFRKLFAARGKVLGISWREGYTILYEKQNGSYIGENHPLMPKMKDVIPDVHEMMREWECDSIFLSCETYDCRELFLKEFGDRVFWLDRRIRWAKDYGISIEAFETIDKQEMAQSYMTEVYLLSKCQCACFAGKTSGNEMAILLRDNGEYEHLKIYDTGRYHAKEYKKDAQKSIDQVL